jgi:hypothetical protein
MPVRKAGENMAANVARVSHHVQQCYLIDERREVTRDNGVLTLMSGRRV